MAITFACTQCQKLLQVRDEFAGQTVRCPFCAATFPCPAATAIASAPAPTIAWEPAPEPEPTAEHRDGDGATSAVPPPPEEPHEEPPPEALPLDEDWERLGRGLNRVAVAVGLLLIALVIWLGSAVWLAGKAPEPVSVWAIALSRPGGPALLGILWPALAGAGFFIAGTWSCRALPGDTDPSWAALASGADASLAILLWLVGGVWGVFSASPGPAACLFTGAILITVAAGMLLWVWCASVDDPKQTESAIKLCLFAGACPVLIGLFGFLMELTASVVGRGVSKRELGVLVLLAVFAGAAGGLVWFYLLLRRVQRIIGSRASQADSAPLAGRGETETH